MVERFLDGGFVGAVCQADQDDDDAEVGVNTRVELAATAAVLRDRINEAHMLAGATIVDPQTTWIDPSVEVEPDTTIRPPGLVLLTEWSKVALPTVSMTTSTRSGRRSPEAKVSAPSGRVGSGSSSPAANRSAFRPSTSRTRSSS